jgi:hypothetical protein
MRSGGSVSTATRMARYVEPHTTYTVARAAQMPAMEAGRFLAPSLSRDILGSGRPIPSS